MPQNFEELDIQREVQDPNLKIKSAKTEQVWSNTPPTKEKSTGFRRLKRFFEKMFPHDNSRRSFIIGAAAGTVGAVDYWKNTENAEANLNNIQEGDPTTQQENPPVVAVEEKQTPPPPPVRESGERFPSKDARNLFEQNVLARSPIEKQSEIGRLMMEQLEAYRRQVGVEKQLANTLYFAPIIELVLRECDYPAPEIEKRKFALLAQIFVESGGNRNAEQWDPECKNSSPRGDLTIGQGLFQVNLKAAKFVVEQYKYNLTNIKDPVQNTEVAVLYTKAMEDIFDDELIAINAYHTGQGNMRFGVEQFLEKRLGVDPAELKNADWSDLKKYLTTNYPALGDRKISLFDIFMDPEIKEAMNAHGKQKDSTISFDYSFKLLAAARLLFEKTKANSAIS